MRITTLLATSAIVLAGWSAGASANLIDNGSFEEGDAPGSYTELLTGSTAIDGWNVNGSIDYIGSLWKASEGSRSLDLSGLSAGSVSQTVSLGALGAGQQYLLEFDLAGNPNGAVEDKDLQVTISGGTFNESQTFTFNTAGKTTSFMGWVTENWIFAPGNAGNYTFTFASLNNSNAGPALDNVRLTVIPIPPAALLFLSGLAGLAFIARRRKGGHNSQPLAA